MKANDDFAALIETADGHLAAGRRLDAEILFGQLVAKDPRSAVAQFGLCRAYLAQGMTKSAVGRKLAAVVECDSSDPDLWIRIAYELRNLGRSADAKRALLKAAECPSSGARVLEHVALVLEQLGELQTLLSLARRIVDLRPNDTTALVRLAEVLTTLGRHEESVRNLMHAVSLSPSEADVLGRLARVAHQAGRSDLSLAAFERALEMAPDYFDGRPSERVIWESLVRRPAL